MIETNLLIKWMTKLTSREVNHEKPRFKRNTAVGSIESTEFRAGKQVRKRGGNKNYLKKNKTHTHGGKKEGEKT